MNGLSSGSLSLNIEIQYDKHIDIAQMEMFKYCQCNFFTRITSCEHIVCVAALSFSYAALTSYCIKPA